MIETKTKQEQRTWEIRAFFGKQKIIVIQIFREMRSVRLAYGRKKQLSEAEVSKNIKHFLRIGKKQIEIVNTKIRSEYQSRRSTEQRKITQKISQD